jgi:16S rRNA (adenine1518-N6/adenine1519-N6)-dimethyltransferase
LTNIRPKKELGQNFLIDNNISSKIVKSFDCHAGDIVVEIGPGTGALTGFLLEQSIILKCIELDKRAVEQLKIKYPENKYSNLEIINDDIRSYNFKKLHEEYEKKIKVIGNIPYNISSDIFFMMFENFKYVEKTILMIQKEVAARLCGKTRTKDYGISTVALDLVGSAKVLFDVPNTCFYPKPKVTSSIIELIFDDQKTTPEEYFKTMKLVKKAFNQRRKTLRNAISDFLPDKESLSLMPELEKYLPKRAEELNSNEFKYLAGILLKSV